MEIKNLSQLKEFIQEGFKFEIVNHYLKPERTGQKRIVCKVKSDGFYSGILNEPEHAISKENDGKGLWLPYGEAEDWKFKENDIISITCRCISIMDIRIIE